jgi:hypothetical protein
MSELKFICPACNQHLQCEKAYVGHKLPCPTCGAELRIPFSNSPGGAPNALPRAELILNTADPKLAGMPGPAGNQENPFENRDIPKHVDVVAHPEPPKTAADEHELHCVCPVCQSELKLRADAASHAGDQAPTAEVVHKAPAPAPTPTASPTPVKAEPSAAGLEHLSPEEREKQIVAARASRPVEVYPAMKPRLSFVLSGGAAPTPSENEAVTHPPPSENPPEPPTKTVQE